MSEKSINPISLALELAKSFGKSEPRVHPDRRDWEAMTFYRRDEA